MNGAQPHYEDVTDERIERALGKTDIIPEFVEWYGNPAYGVTVRIETHMGRFMECRLTPWMTDDQLVSSLVRLSEDLDGTR